MKRCIIVGAGGAGVEVLEWTRHMIDKWQEDNSFLDPSIDERAEGIEIVGFLDANPDAPRARNIPYPVLGDPEMWAPKPDELFVPAFGDSKTRTLLCDSLVARGARLLTVIHPSAMISDSATIGNGSVICPQVIVGPNAKIGRLVFVNSGSIIGHDAQVGDGSTIFCHCDVTGGVTIGNECTLGTHAVITPGRRVGDGVGVGAGSTVCEDVPAHLVVMGVPARPLIMRK